MKRVSSQPKLAQLAAAFVVVGLLVALVLAYPSGRKPLDQSIQEPPSSPQETTQDKATSSSSSETDEERILQAVRADIVARDDVPARGSQLILRRIKGDFAQVSVNVNPAGGYFYILRKQAQGWVPIFWGQNLDPDNLGFGIPADFFDGPDTHSDLSYEY